MDGKGIKPFFINCLGTIVLERETKIEHPVIEQIDLMIMTAAVDMKPTLTIIKSERMDGE